MVMMTKEINVSLTGKAGNYNEWQSQGHYMPYHVVLRLVILRNTDYTSTCPIFYSEVYVDNTK
jgi:hypothetical protein